MLSGELEVPTVSHGTVHLSRSISAHRHGKHEARAVFDINSYAVTSKKMINSRASNRELKHVQHDVRRASIAVALQVQNTVV